MVLKGPVLFPFLLAESEQLLLQKSLHLNGERLVWVGIAVHSDSSESLDILAVGELDFCVTDSFNGRRCVHSKHHIVAILLYHSEHMIQILLVERIC